MAEEKTQSNRKINKKLIIIAAAIIIVATIGLIALIVPKTVKAQRLEKQLDLGAKYLSELDYEQAVVAYLAAIEIDPKCEVAYFALVDTYVAMGEYDKAEEILDKAEKELGKSAVKDKRVELEAKKNGTVGPGTTTPEQETTTSEHESTTQEPETTEPTIKADIYQIFTKVAEDEKYVSISFETEKLPEGEYSFHITFSNGNTTHSIMVGNEGHTSGVAYRQTDSGYICTLRKEYFSNIQDVAVIWISIDGGVANTEVVRTTDYNAYIKELGTSGNVAEGQTIYVWDGNCEKDDKVLFEDKYLYLQDVYKVTSGSRYTNESFEYRKSAGTDGIIITGLVNTRQSKLVIPETIDGKKVVGIEKDVAKYSDYITEVILPDSVIWIESGAFAWCDNLSSVSFSNNLEWIGEDAFNRCSLKNLELPESLLSIGKSAFEQALATEYEGLYEKRIITIPKNVEEIGEAAFCNNENLKGFIISEGNENFIVSNDVLYTKNYETLLAMPEALAASSYYVQEGCQNIGKSAFMFCDKLESVHIPDTVREIGEEAFYGCSKLKNVVLPKGLQEIKFWTFGYCEALQEITIPDTVSVIRKEAFDGCRMLEKIDIPTEATHIWKDAFKGTLWLKNKVAENPFVIVNGSLIAIPDNLKGEVVIPSGITAIGEGVFSWNSDITSVIVPEGVTYIGESAFEGSGITSISISNGVTGIGDGAFSNCSKLKSIEIPESVTELGSMAFYYCTSLESITISGSVTSIGELAFYECASLVNVEIPESVTHIGSDAFAFCASLENITIPESVTSIGESAFNGCSLLKSIIIPKNIESIGDSAFSRCNSLESVVIPESVTSIGKHTFYRCNSLKSVIISEGVESIGDFAFYDCALLESIVIPKSVTSMGKYTFENSANVVIHCKTGSYAETYAKERAISYVVE